MFHNSASVLTVCLFAAAGCGPANRPGAASPQAPQPVLKARHGALCEAVVVLGEYEVNHERLAGYARVLKGLWRECRLLRLYGVDHLDTLASYFEAPVPPHSGGARDSFVSRFNSCLAKRSKLPSQLMMVTRCDGLTSARVLRRGTITSAADGGYASCVQDVFGGETMQEFHLNLSGGGGRSGSAYMWGLKTVDSSRAKSILHRFIELAGKGTYGVAISSLPLFIYSEQFPCENPLFTPALPPLESARSTPEAHCFSRFIDGRQEDAVCVP